MQHDTSPAHEPTEDKEVIEARYHSKKTTIKLEAQSPKSLDFNILDLDSFAEIEPQQHEEALFNVEELVDAVRIAFDTYHLLRTDDNSLTLQKCMKCSMKIEEQTIMLYYT